MSDSAQHPQQTGRDTVEPAEIEALLPWYVTGRLRRRHRQSVEVALRRDTDLARQVDLVREELAETIHLNESLGAPSPRVMDRLMTAIDAETSAARARSSAHAVAGRFGTLIASISPRSLALAASLAILAIGLQAIFLAEMLTKPESAIENAGMSGEIHGPFALVRFARQASAGEITSFLKSYQATLVDGPKDDGLYRIKIGVTALAKGEVARIVARMRKDQVVDYAAADE